MHGDIGDGVSWIENKVNVYGDETGSNGQVSVGEYISRCPMPLKGLHCQVSKLFNSDTCPRPTTQGGALAVGRWYHLAWAVDSAGEFRTIQCSFERLKTAEPRSKLL